MKSRIQYVLDMYGLLFNSMSSLCPSSITQAFVLVCRLPDSVLVFSATLCRERTLLRAVAGHLSRLLIIAYFSSLHVGEMSVLLFSVNALTVAEQIETQLLKSLNGTKWSKSVA